MSHPGSTVSEWKMRTWETELDSAQVLRPWTVSALGMICPRPGETSHDPKRNLSSCDIAVGSLYPISLSFVQFLLEVTIHMYRTRERLVFMPVRKEYGDSLRWGWKQLHHAQQGPDLSRPWEAIWWIARRHDEGVIDKELKCVCPESWEAGAWTNSPI